MSWKGTDSVILHTKLEKAAQGVTQCEVSAYAPSCRQCVATYWKEDMAVTKLQISPVIVSGF